MMVLLMLDFETSFRIFFLTVTSQIIRKYSLSILITIVILPFIVNLPCQMLTHRLIKGAIFIAHKVNSSKLNVLVSKQVTSS
jgi:hypothetical protein